MSFQIDKQTINDLEIFGQSKNDNSIFKLFEYTKSIGGRNRLEHMFGNPLSNPDEIKERISIIRQFEEYTPEFKIDKAELDFIEHYLAQGNPPHGYSRLISFFDGVKYRIKQTNEEYIIHRGITYLIDFLYSIYQFSEIKSDQRTPEVIRKKKNEIRAMFASSDLNYALKFRKKASLSAQVVGKLDYSFRSKNFNLIRKLLDTVYFIDIYRSIATAKKVNGFCLPEYSDESNYYSAKELYHPLLDNPVRNSISYDTGFNICFLTGPNMAGKSTFLKAISISVYLAHLGFPVPAAELKIAFFKGLLTTINLSDNVKAGYSHFYSEVLRVKYVAEAINKFGNYFIVFDELFRGTNVKDAYEASLAVISAFAKLKKGVFAISTHIIEIADELKKSGSVFYKFFEANIKDGVPQYNYELKDGITAERIGMYILKKERIVEIIENSSVTLSNQS